MLQVASIQVTQANKPASPRLSVERDFELMTPWMELLSTTRSTIDARIQKERMSKSVHLEGTPPETPRRLTRALARKLQQSSTETVEPKQEPTSENKEQLIIQKAEREAKGGKGGRNTVSASPPGIVVYTEHGVKVEPVSAALPFSPSADPTEKLIIDSTVRVRDNECSGCGVKTNPLSHRDHAGNGLCEHCHRTVADAEKGLQAEIHERRLRIRDDAILLPPPSTHKIATRIRQDLSGKLSGPAPSPKRQEGTELLPILELDEPRSMFASYRQSGPPRLGMQQRPGMCNPRQSSSDPRRLGFPKGTMPYPMGPPRSQPPIWHTVRSAPYHLPVRAQAPPRAIASTPRRFAHQPHRIGTLRSEPHRQSALTLLDIKRRRSMLLDLREVALDLLEETSTVLTQVDKALPKLAAKRGRSVKASTVA